MSVTYNFHLGTIRLKPDLVTPDNEVRHGFSKGVSIWHETDVPHAQKIEGFTNGLIPLMLLVESDLIKLIGGRLRYHLAISKAEFRFDLHRAVKGLRDSVSVLMCDEILKPVYDRTAGETLIGTILALHDVSDKPLNLVVEKGFSPPRIPPAPVAIICPRVRT